MLVLVVLLLCGCAARNAYRDGQALVEEGRTAEGLAKLAEAMRREPGSAEYRLGYLRARERYGQLLVDQADAALAEGRYDVAEGRYREALGARANPERATTGLQRVEQHRRRDLEIKAAEIAILRKEWDIARSKLATVRMEHPQNAQVARLLKVIEDQTSVLRAEPALSAAYRRPISLEFRDVPLRTIFEVISRTSQLNFLFDKEVKTDQRASIYLRNSTIEAAVNWLLLTNQLEQRVLDNSSVLIYPATQAKQREYQPLVVKSFFLTNAEAKNVASTLKTLLKLKDVVVDDRLNLVIVRDSQEAARLAEKLVALHDAPEPEVMLEVEVLEVKRGRLLDLGVRWPDQVGLSLLPAAGGQVLTLEDLRRPSRNDIGVAVASGAVIAKKVDSDTSILANPRIRTRNREKANILIGEKVPNITATSTAVGFVAESVNYVDVGIKLTVEPTIYLDGEVAIKVALEVSNIISQQQTKSGSLAYQLGTRSAQTVLRLKDGENQVLAGLINDEDRRSANKVPGLGDLPLIGRLFGNQSSDGSKTEIVLSITPRILRNVMRPEAQAMEFDAGTEASLKSWPGESSNIAGAPVKSSVAPDVSDAAIERRRDSPSPPVSAQALPTTQQGILPPPVSEVVTSSIGTLPGASLIRWEGPTRVAPDETFALQLVMQTEQSVNNVPVVIAFDPAVIQLVSTTEGSLMKEGGATTKFLPRTVGSGRVAIAVTRDRGGATGPGVLATLTFKAGAAIPTNTETAIRFLSAAATATNGMPVAVQSPGPLTLTVVK